MNWGTLYPSDVVRFVKRYYSTTSSRKNVLRSFRNFATEFYPEMSAEWLDLCRLPAHEHRRQKRADKARVLMKADNPLICDVENYLRIMCELLADKSQAACLAAGLLMATGRRTIEIAECGGLKMARMVAPVHARFWLHFSGPAKKRTKLAPGEIQPIHWDIPVLVNAEQLLHCFNLLRASPEGKKGVKSRFWQRDVKEVLKAKFATSIPEMLPKTCRAIYAKVSYYIFNPVVAVNLWTMRSLGHVKIGTSLNYLSVHVHNVRNPCETQGMILPFIRLGQQPHECANGASQEKSFRFEDSDSKKNIAFTADA